MMNGIVKEELINNLKKMQQALCAYRVNNTFGGRCDCKFINKNTKHVCASSEDGSGCPELYQIVSLLEALTDRQFNTLRKKAKLSIDELDFQDKKDKQNKKYKMKKLTKKQKRGMPLFEIIRQEIMEEEDQKFMNTLRESIEANI